MKKSKETQSKEYLRELLIIVLVIIFALIKYMVLPNENEAAHNENDVTIATEAVSIENNVTTATEANINIKIDDIPKYSGKIVISINNDKPYFEEKDISTQDFEYYSNLDEQNRAGVAFANICKYTMPPKGVKRESLSYKPSGWVQYLYGENNKEHLYERCHLIAWQLGNENNNKKNLITGTSQMNEAMIEYENMVANWIKQKNAQGKDYHVLYRVTPIYEGNNKVATGVEIEAKSVEEEGVCFNKFIYNVQDNFKINYSTGEAKLLK